MGNRNQSGSIARAIEVSVNRAATWLHYDGRKPTSRSRISAMSFLRMSLGSCFLFFASTAIAEWPQWRGPLRVGSVESGSLIETLPQSGLMPEWKFESLTGGNSGGWGSPVISDGKVFVYSHTKNKTGDPGEKKYPWLAPDKRVGMSDAEYQEYEVKRREEDERHAQAFEFEQRLVCLDFASGEVVWDRKSPATYTRFVQSGTPCVAAGKVYVLGPARTAACYDAATGNVIWEQRLPGEFRDEYFASSFVVDGDVALVACGPIYALNANDGRILWSGDAKSDFGSHSSPVVWRDTNGTVAICNTSGGRTQAYRIDDGQKIWELQTGVGQSSPIVAGDLLLTYGSSRKTGLTAYSLSAVKEPQELWRFNGASDSGSTPVVLGEHVFVQGEKRLAKVRLQDGKRIWQSTMKISTPKYTSLIAMGDQVIFAWEGVLSIDAQGDRFREIYDAEIDADAALIRGEDLREKLGLAELEKSEGGLAKAESLWQKNAIRTGPLRCSTPAASDGRLVIRLNDALVCYDLRQ